MSLGQLTNEKDLDRFITQKLGEFGLINMASILGTLGGERLVPASVGSDKLLLETASHNASSNLGLSGSEQDVPGAAFTTGEEGDWMITANVHGDSVSGSAEVRLSVGGVNDPAAFLFVGADNGSRTWLVADVPASTVIKLVAIQHSGGPGTVYSPNTGIVGVRHG